MEFKPVSKFVVFFLLIKTKFLSLTAKICRLLKRSVVYENKQGLKQINPINVALLTRGERILIPYSKLYLGVDFLNDKKTLIDVPIVESPHYYLMKTLEINGDYKQTEYVQRMLRGCLDERYEIVSYYLQKNYFQKAYEKSKRGVEEDTNTPVTVYAYNDKYYIYDGKHRAAICALLKKGVWCNVIDLHSAMSGFNRKLKQRIIKSKKYKKHHNFLTENS